MFNTLRVHLNEGAPATGGAAGGSGSSAASGADSGSGAATSEGAAGTGGASGSGSGGPASAWDAMRDQVTQGTGDQSGATATGGAAATGDQAEQGGAAAAQGAPSAEALRVAELESKLARYQKFDPVVARLESEGYNDAGAVEAFLTKQQQDNALATHMGTVQEKLQARVDAGVLSPEEALEDYKTEMSRQQQVMGAQLISNQYAAMQVENAMNAALTAHPVLKVGRSEDGTKLGKGESLVRALHKSNPGLDVGKIAEYVAGNLTELQQMAVTEHTAKTAQTQQTPPILNGGGGNGGGNGSASGPLSFTERLMQKAGLTFKS